MQRRQLLLGLLILAHVALNALAVSPVGELYESVLLSVLPASQGSLLAVWAVLAGKPAPWRLAGATALVALSVWWTTLSPEVDPSCTDFQSWATWCGLQMVAASVPLLIGRFAGMRIAAVPLDDSGGGAADPAWRAQFSIRSLLEWTAGLAVLLGVSPYLWYWSPSPKPFRWDLILLVFHTCYAFVALAAIWVALGRRCFATRAILLVLAVAGGASAVEAAFCALTGARKFDVLSDFLFHALWLVGSLWLVRVAGYRLIWRGRVTL
jgi:hypothetical protein